MKIKHHTPFGEDRFGILAERFARFFGTPKFIITQTVLVVIWITINIIGYSFRWDPYPFILLNLAFSTQAAYAAPLILLAQTRQADRDKLHQHQREQIAQNQEELLIKNTNLTEEIARLTQEIHGSSLVNASKIQNPSGKIQDPSGEI